MNETETETADPHARIRKTSARTGRKVETLTIGEEINPPGLYIRGAITALGDLIPVYRRPGVFARYVTCQRSPGSWISTMITDGDL